jgi:cytochrome c oxidase subunit 2
MPIALVLLVLVIGSVVFHYISPWRQTPIASNWSDIDSALSISILVCGFFFIVLNLFLALAIVRYRHRAGRRAAFAPENPGLERRLTLWTAVGIAVLLAPGLMAWARFVTVPETAATVEVVGEQWRWAYRFPGADRVLGTASIKHVTADNPFGLNPRDPYARDDILVEGGDLHLPLGRPVKLLLRSKDVLHDFYVPQFRAKMDLVPGVVTYFWLTPRRTGTFDILCAELCGIGHYQMRGSVTVESEPAFRKWLQEQPSFSQLIASAPGDGSEAPTATASKAEGAPAKHRSGVGG